MRHLLLTLAVIVGCVPCAVAQPTVRVPLTAVWVNAEPLGYKQGPELGLGFEVETPHLAAFTQAVVGFRHKTETGDGRELNLTQHLCGRWRGWLGCGGVVYADTTTSRWSKGTARPIVGVGAEDIVQGRYMRVMVDYEIGAFDTANHLHGLDMEIRYGRPDFFVVAGFGVYLFHATDRPDLPDHGERLHVGLGFDPVTWRSMWR